MQPDTQAGGKPANGDLPEAMKALAQAEATAHGRYPGARTLGAGPITASVQGIGPLDTGWHGGQRPATPAELDAFEAFCREQGVPPTLHLLSTFAPEQLPLLRERGYGLDYVLNAYLHDLRELPGQVPTGVALHAEASAERWAALSAAGFGPGNEAIMTAVSRAPGIQRFRAQLAGQDAGSAAMMHLGEVAMLYGTSTLPEHRGQGVQTALLAHRLELAAAAGARWASVYVTPGTASERNILRAGFRLAGLRLTFSR